MSPVVDLQIVCEDEEQPPSSAIERWIHTTLRHRAEDISPDDAELTVRIVDEVEMRALNRDYRGKDKTTNVLSFPAELPDHIELPLLGDVVVCAAVVNREAQEQHKPPEHHWAHMIVHGCLHLLGYDHIDDAEAEMMESLEVAILAQLNIANPYLDITDLTNNNAVNL